MLFITTSVVTESTSQAAINAVCKAKNSFRK